MDGEHPLRRWAPYAAAGTAALGVFLPWTSDGPVRLDGTEGPHNGWLVVIVAAFALGWIHSMQRGSWVGAIGVFGAAAVIVWTALEGWLDTRAVTGASASYGLVVVVLAGLALGTSAVVNAIELARGRASLTR